LLPLDTSGFFNSAVMAAGASPDPESILQLMHELLLTFELARTWRCSASSRFCSLRQSVGR
jgi:hypothetical protein